MRHAGHAKRVIALLEQPESCRACPGQALMDLQPRCINLLDMEMAFRVGNAISNYCYNICRSFISITEEEDEACDHCPCLILGPAGAAKRTWLALEEKGFI